jgi:hypothetical protein
VKWTAVVAGRRPLAIAEERLPDMTERDFFDIAERLNRWIFALSSTGPGPQQGREHGDVGVEVGHVRQGTS